MRKTLFLFFLLIVPVFSHPCTTFVLKTPTDLLFGRNLDWVSDNGILVVNQRKLYKTSLTFPPDKSISWISKYGSVTFNQFGREFPFGGINEKGLVVEIMLADAQYPEADDRAAVNELQWIQYQLDNFSTVEEVIESDTLLRISSVKQELHYLVSDASGNVAVIEFRNGKMLAYTGESLPVTVLENDVYDKSLGKYERKTACRFATAASMVQAYRGSEDINAVDYSFSILDSVALQGSWSIVYDIKNLAVHFKTESNPKIQGFELSAFDYACNSSPMMFDLRQYKGSNISPQFDLFTSKMNLEKMKDAIETNEILLPKPVLDLFYEYHKKQTCEVCKEN